MSTSQPRKPKGIPAGGQFASKGQPESSVAVETDEPWSWDSVANELGQEEADRLRSESGGSLGKAIAMAVGRGRTGYIARQAERATCACGHVLAEHFLPAHDEPEPFTYCRAGCRCTGFRLSHGSSAVRRFYPDGTVKSVAI